MKKTPRATCDSLSDAYDMCLEASKCNKKHSRARGKRTERGEAAVFAGYKKQNIAVTNAYMLFTGREVRIGKKCIHGLEYGGRGPYLRPIARAQFFPLRTDLGR